MVNNALNHFSYRRRLIIDNGLYFLKKLLQGLGHNKLKQLLFASEIVVNQRNINISLRRNISYFGSGIALLKAIAKHGKENFVKEILFVFDTEEEMNNKEKEKLLFLEFPPVSTKGWEEKIFFRQRKKSYKNILISLAPDTTTRAPSAMNVK